MVQAVMRRTKIFYDKLKLVSSKDGNIKSYIITGIGVKIDGKLSNPKLYDEIVNHMDKVIRININNKKDNNVLNINSNKKVKIRSKSDGVSFSNWIKDLHTDEELQKLLLNMDIAMKYIHNKNYCIKSFMPKDISILNDSLDRIKFKTLLKMPRDDYDKRELVREDIYSSAFLQIAAYMNKISTNNYNDSSLEDFLKNMKPDFLRSNFDGFSTFIPEDLVPYFRGIVQRGSSVYLSDYVKERKKRDLDLLRKEIGEDTDNTNKIGSSQSNNKGKILIKSDGRYSSREKPIDNNSINKEIYSQLSNMDAAFVKTVILPIIMVVFGIALMVIAYIFSN